VALERLRGLMPARPLARIALLLVLAGAAITAEDFAAIAAGLTGCDVNSVPDAGPAVVP